MSEIKYPDILLDALENGHMIVNDDFIVSYWNRWLAINTQIPKEEIIGKSLEHFFPQINFQVLRRKIKTALSIGTPTFYDSNSTHKFIPIARGKVSTSSLQMMQQQVTISPYIVQENKVMLSIYDISELFEAKLLIKKEMHKVHKLNEKLEVDREIIDKNIMALKTSATGVIRDVSSFFCDFFKLGKEELVGKNISRFKLQDASDVIYKEMWESIKNKKPWSGELQFEGTDGKQKWFQTRVVPLLDAHENIAEFNAVFHDITNEKLLAELSVTDPLTKLYNRAHFDKTIESAAKHQRKADFDFVLALVDIDHFKSINDTYGHQIGDEVLMGVAKIIKNSLREDDLVARWGGEEFVVMLKKSNLEQAKTIVEKIRLNIEKSRLCGDIRVTASFGVTDYKEGEETKETFKRVDEALYEAKRSGRNRVVVREG